MHVKILAFTTVGTFKSKNMPFSLKDQLLVLLSQVFHLIYFVGILFIWLGFATPSTFLNIKRNINYGLKIL
jgi:fluoride ion exporter CrcB/FEX